MFYAVSETVGTFLFASFLPCIYIPDFTFYIVYILCLIFRAAYKFFVYNRIVLSHQSLPYIYIVFS